MLFWIALRPSPRPPTDFATAAPFIVALLPLPEPLQVDPPPVRLSPPKTKAEAGGQQHRERHNPLRQPAMAPFVVAPVDAVDITPVPIAIDLSSVEPGPPSLVPQPDLGSGRPGLAIGEHDGSGTGQGDGVGSGATTPTVLNAANWVRVPSDDALSPFIPRKAIARRVSGNAIIACRVQLSTHVHDCRTLAESASGLGFGDAAITASRIFRIYPPRHNGKPLVDAWVGIPVSWVVKGAPRAPAQVERKRASDGGLAR